MQQDNSIPVGPDPTNNVVTPNSYKKKRGEGLKSILSTLVILIAAPLTAIFLTTFVFQSYEVDGPSMETTLQNQDRLIVWKLHRTVSRVTKKPFIPKRGEIVVFVKQGLFGDTGEEKQIIKRVVGLPGERVVVGDGKITIYNDEYPDGFNPDINKSFSAGIAAFTDRSVDLVVPANEVFVCGDNRTNSLDSRAFGTVRANDIVGELALRILPVKKFENFL